MEVRRDPYGPAWSNVRGVTLPGMRLPSYPADEGGTPAYVHIDMSKVLNETVKIWANPGLTIVFEQLGPGISGKTFTWSEDYL